MANSTDNSTDKTIHEDSFNKLIINKLDQIILQNEQIIEENKNLKIQNHKLTKSNLILQKNIDRLLENMSKKENEMKIITKKVDPIEKIHKEIQSYAEKVSACQSPGSSNQAEVITAMNKNFEGLRTDLDTKFANDKETALENKLINIKKNNLCIFNLPESKEQDKKQAFQDDIKKLKTIFPDLKKEDVAEIYRIQPKKKTKNPRPIIMKLNSFEKKMEILQLKDVYYKNEDKAEDLDAQEDTGKTEDVKIFITPDRTIKQQLTHRKLVEELRERRSKGEEGLIIKNEKIVVQDNRPFRQSPQSYWG